MNSPEPKQQHTIIDLIAADLAIVVGPVAGYILTEKIRNFGFSHNNFPIERIPELIEESSLEISDENKRVAYLVERDGPLNEAQEMRPTKRSK